MSTRRIAENPVSWLYRSQSMPPSRIRPKFSTTQSAATDTGNLGRLPNRAMQLPGRERIGVAAPGEQPSMREHHAAPLAFALPQAEQLEQ